MYYQTVNRGVSFTKPGLYTLGLVFLLGFIATGSGYNALYLSLSLGLALLIVSGLLSEKVMKHFELERVEKAEAEAFKAFSLRFHGRNLSSHFSVFGVENLVVSKLPKFKLFKSELPHLTQSTFIRLLPNEKNCQPALFQGMARGHYRNFKVVQRTSFPFGLLHKFKVSKVSTDIKITPQWQDKLAKQLRDALKMKKFREGEEEFHSHRPYQSRDSLRHLNWKKSAGLDSSQWVLKTYERPVEVKAVEIVFDLGELDSAASLTQYETLLARLWTAVEVINQEGREVFWRNRKTKWVRGAELIHNLILSAPDFAHRETGLKVVNHSPPPSEDTLKLSLYQEHVRLY